MTPTIEFLRSLKGMQVPLAVVSSFEQNTVEHFLKASKCDDLFEVWSPDTHLLHKTQVNARRKTHMEELEEQVKIPVICPNAIVTNSLDKQTSEQLLLTAAIALDRPPSKCAVVDTSPYAVRAACDIGMKSVAVLTGGFSRAELKDATVAVLDVEDLSLHMIQQLFSS